MMTHVTARRRRRRRLPIYFSVLQGIVLVLVAHLWLLLSREGGSNLRLASEAHVGGLVVVQSFSMTMPNSRRCSYVQPSRQRNTFFACSDNRYSSRPLYWSSSSSGDAAQGDGSDKKWTLENDFETFLNQCSIQTFVFLLRGLRDPQTVLWVENFTQPSSAVVKQTRRPAESDSGSTAPDSNNSTTISEDADDVPIDSDAGTEDAPASTAGNDNSLDEYAEKAGWVEQSRLLQYHGLHAINTTLFPSWDTYFGLLLQQPSETIRVLSKSPYVPDYELDINPPSLCSRLISVREQIAREFANDLGVIASMGGNTLESYWEKLRQQRGKKDDKGGESDGEMPRISSDDFRLQRENLLFLDYSLNDGNDYAPSPLRKGNFDLLVLLATQEGIHRVLNGDDFDQGDGKEKATRGADAVLQRIAAKRFLRTFYEDRVSSHFSGKQRYGRADDFLEELLAEAPRTVTVPSFPEEDSSEDPITCLIDPNRIATRVLEERSNAALEWQEIAKDVPQLHTQIKRMQLNLLMGIAEPTGDANAGSTEADSVFE